MVLLDEPTLGLDPKTCTVVFDSTRTMNDLGVTVALMVEQNVRFGLQLASHGVVIERGRVPIAESAGDLLARDDMGAMFLGAALAQRRPDHDPHFDPHFDPHGDLHP